jgi:arylsulfatase A-like enzyme
LLQQLSLKEVTLATRLSTAGYTTAHIGKWHLGGAGYEPEKHGFDINIAGDHTGTPLSYFAPFRRGDRFMPGLEKADEGEYLTDRLTSEAERFLDRHKDRPFFLYMPHYAVHTPLTGKAELVKKYPPKGVAGRQSNAIYAAMLESLDECVGRIVRKLVDLKLDDNTILVFTSDNGGLATLEGPNTPPTINTPFREGKGYLYEGGHRVPLVIKWPGVSKGGTTSGVPVITQDLHATILEACGVTADGVHDGVSLVPLLRGTGAIKRDALYWHYPHYSNQRSKPGGAIRVGDHKLIEFYEDGRRELFDLKVDVSESRNLAAEKPELVKQLAERLHTWRKEVGAKMPRPNPDYLPHPQAANGVIEMPSAKARIFGTQLRYEPLPHKNTLGYWTEVNDQAQWEFTVKKPGTFTVEVMQGCGKGHGGSEVDVEVAKQTVRFTVEDTGHFQNFKTRAIGTVEIKSAGRHTLTIKPRKKAKAAIMDVRQVVLRPVKE